MAGIVTAALLIYSNSFRGVFVLDEQPAIVDNPNIRSLTTSFSAPRHVGLGGRPIASLSFALNYALAPAPDREVFAEPATDAPAAWDRLYANLWGYHAVNLTVHVACALLLFGVVRRTLTGPRLVNRFGRAAIPLATVVALLWVAHPLQTNAVTYVAQRVESLMALFYLLTLYCAIRAAGYTGKWNRAGADEPRTTGTNAGARLRYTAWTIGAVVACALGAGTKEIIASAPLIVVLYDWLFAGNFSAVVRRRWPLYVGLAASWAIIAALALNVDHSASVGVGVGGWSAWSYLITQAAVIVHYLRLTVVPAPLSLDYHWPPAESLAAVLPQAAVLALSVGLTAWAACRRRPAAFLGAWFFLILAPSSSVLPIATEVAAEHRMYLPVAAVIALVVLLAYDRVARLDDVRRRLIVRVLSAVALLAVAVFGMLAHARNEDYSSYERIWQKAAAAQPGNPRARGNYGAALVGLGRFTEAEEELRTALRLRPAYAEAHMNLGVALCSQGRLEEGVDELRRALALEPDYRDAWRNVAEAEAAMGRLHEAAFAYRKALESAPDDPGLLARLAWTLATAPDRAVRDGSAAVPLAERAVVLTHGADADTLDTLAAAYAAAGRFEEAVSAAAKAVALTGGRQDGPGTAYSARLHLYRRGLPYEQPVAAPASWNGIAGVR